MYQYGDIIELEKNVKIEIKGIFNSPEKFYSININGINKRIDEELLDFLVCKFKIIEEKEEKEEIKNGRIRNKNKA